MLQRRVSANAVPQKRGTYWYRYMNNNQLHTVFISSLLSYHTSTCFGLISSPWSSIPARPVDSQLRSITSTIFHIQCGLGSRTIRFTNKFSEQKMSRMTNGFSDYEHASWQQWQAESISAGVSRWLTLTQYTYLLDFGLRTFRFTNGLQERIKFVNRGPTVYIHSTSWWWAADTPKTCRGVITE
jgi:hypothetical protein